MTGDAGDVVNGPLQSRAVHVAVIVEALRDAGLLVGSSASLPEVLNDLVDDSRRVAPGAGFVAVKGHAQDGHDWIATAQQAGAALVIVEDQARVAAL